MTLYYYVYRLTCTHPDSKARYYYGARQCRCLPPEDTRYWSSSRVVAAARRTLGKEWFRKKIVSVHSTREEALKKEIRLHTCFNVRDNPLFFNQANQTSIGFTPGPLSPESRKKISAALLKNQHTRGRQRPLEEREKISQTMKTKPRPSKTEFLGDKRTQRRAVSETTREKISQARSGQTPFLGKRHSEATRVKISQAMKASYARRHPKINAYPKKEFSSIPKKTKFFYLKIENFEGG